MAITFDKLYEKWIKQIKEATSAEDLIIDSNAMRKVAEAAAVHVLDLDKEISNDWMRYYQLESKKIRTGQSKKDQSVLDAKAAALVSSGKITIAHAKKLKDEILQEVAGNYHVGHIDHGPAMDKARLIYDNANIVDKLGGTIPQGPGKKPLYGITLEQKEMLRKIIFAQQSIERAKHSEILNIKKKLGLGEKDTRLNDKVLIDYLSTIDEKIHLNADFVIQTKPNGPELAYAVNFETETSNSDSGELTRLLGIKLNRILRISDEKTMKEFKKSKFAETLMNVPGSNTLFKRFGNYISSLILGKKYSEKSTPTHTRKTTIKNKRSSKLTSLVNKAKKAKQKAAAVIRRTKIEEPKVPLVGIFNVMGLINFILGNEIRAQMGESSDPPTRLRWQTGRFADNAKLIALKESRGKPIRPGVNIPPLVGIYTYLHYPYDVFLPNHPLDNGLRDPRVYIERGIRSAARTILESRYPGMVLEPD